MRWAGLAKLESQALLCRAPTWEPPSPQPGRRQSRRPHSFMPGGFSAFWALPEGHLEAVRGPQGCGSSSASLTLLPIQLPSDPTARWTPAPDPLSPDGQRRPQLCMVKSNQPLISAAALTEPSYDTESPTLRHPIHSFSSEAHTQPQKGSKSP